LITQDDFIENERDIADHPNAKHFDWRELSAICVSPVPEHPAYGASFDEYAKYRKEVADDEGTEKSRLAFRIPKPIAFGLPVLAKKHSTSKYKVSANRYVSLLIEMGMISFQRDYYDQCESISCNTEKLFDASHDERSLMVTLQIQKQTISLESSSRSNKLYCPMVPAWLDDAVRSTAFGINMSVSDLVYVCVCKGLLNDLKEQKMPKAYVERVTSTLDYFEFELGQLEMRASDLTHRFNAK
jgi:hypothetical protein